MDPLYFATSNQGKLEEAQHILEIPVLQAPIALVEIQSLDLKEIAREKARQAFEQLGKPVFVDDVALSIGAWNGFPGPFIKHLLEAVGTEGILRMMANEKNRAAAAQLVIGFHDGKQVRTFEGERKGTIAMEEKGNSGFGWDALFIPEGTDKTYAELTQKEKNAVSHRMLALEQFRSYLQAQHP